MTQPSRFSRGLSEIVLIVGDVLASARFYREVVGLVPDTHQALGVKGK
jgi:catechol 2,3-dioxygenase-like lactoylglutathione lyase family enzyme